MLPVTKIQHFCTGDGPGIRTTVFLKGCPLHCLWCHNRETGTDAPPFFYTPELCVHCGACATVCPQNAHRVTDTEHLVSRTLCGRCMKCGGACPTGALEPCIGLLSVEDIFADVLKDAAFYGSTGGVTLSGGEPTVHAEQLISLLRPFRQGGVHTAIETCGFFDPLILPRLTEVTDLFLWDIKDTDKARHIRYTGVSNRVIPENLKRADALGAKTVLRCILLRSVNLTDTHLRALISVVRSLKHCTVWN